MMQFCIIRLRSGRSNSQSLVCDRHAQLTGDREIEGRLAKIRQRSAWPTIRPEQAILNPSTCNRRYPKRGLPCSARDYRKWTRSWGRLASELSRRPSNTLGAVQDVSPLLPDESWEVKRNYGHYQAAVTIDWAHSIAVQCDRAMNSWSILSWVDKATILGQTPVSTASMRS